MDKHDGTSTEGTAGTADSASSTDPAGISDSSDDDGAADTIDENGGHDVAYLKPLDNDFSRQLLGHRYLLEKRISVGTVSTLYRAKDRRLGTTVAVKVLHPEYNKNSDLARRFAQEARLASQVRHQNLVPALDFGWLGGKRFIVFELVDGPTVHDLITEEPLPWRRATALICDLLAGLAALHEAGVAHRDISPVNCLVDTAHGERGRLIDLGYARLLDKRGRLDIAMQPKSKSKIIYGTEGYIELERLNGGRGDYRADIFSMGAVWYAMLMGRTPLDPAGLDEAFTPIVLPLPMPEPLVAVLRGALAPRKERHHSAVSMLRAIRDALQQIDAQEPQTRGGSLWTRRAVVLAPALAVGVVAAWLLPAVLRCPDPSLVAAATQNVETAPPILAEPAPAVAQSAPALPQPAPDPAPPVLPAEDISPPTAPSTWQTSDETILANSPSPKRNTTAPSSALRRALVACKSAAGARLDIEVAPGKAVTINDGPARGELGRCIEEALAKHPPKRPERFKL
ncbi:serine/threonine-protein kinase [Nannocystis pusilla]|uniref:Serine/threonine protein kinase n=1 Tax=Nannocystis pusilla TaxID=889268 RepID=A0ABS7TM51_9BACT|nr:serine/threonine-protein kinase [Nannocystis pusilla]MBZ5709297.1 serine/threonine protein kinase [Nannocystis pusilla]